MTQEENVMFLMRLAVEYSPVKASRTLRDNLAMTSLVADSASTSVRR